MTLYGAIFYLLAALIVLSTALAVTRRDLVHAILYLVVSFFGSALLFYLLGAPLLAALEVIIYAGAIMILFLFIIMMLPSDDPRTRPFTWGQLLPAAALAGVYLIAGVLVLGAANSDPAAAENLPLAVAEPLNFGIYLFQGHWLAIEIASLLLLIALLGALCLAREPHSTLNGDSEAQS
ncbi:MAG: NADH-quinone oxidoreductase subunit J [Desulfobacterales bacterium]|jgi:NADH-quinone oxidoreductase subunit J